MSSRRLLLFIHGFVLSPGGLGTGFDLWYSQPRLCPDPQLSSPMQASQLGDPCCFTEGAAKAQRGPTICKRSWQDVSPECLAPESVLLNTILCQIQTYSIRLTHRELNSLAGVFPKFTTLSKWGPSNPTAGHKP